MGELTEKEKAQKYDEAIRRAKISLGCCDSASTTTKNLVYDIFPELKNKDEEIRKAIIEFFELQDDNTTYSLIPKKDILAWLEKQSESDETKATMFLINKGYPVDANGTFPTYEELYNIIREGLEEQAEQKSAEWSEEDDAYKELAICAVANFYDEENPLNKCIVNWLKSLKDKIKEK